MSRILLAVFLLAVAASVNAAVSDPRARFESALGVGAGLEAVQNRARLLAAWANEAEDRGVALPVDLLPAVSRALSLNAADSPAAMAGINDRMVARGRELAVLEENPEIAGRGEFEDSNEPLVAGQRTRLRQIYQVGTTLEPGAALIIAKHWRYPYSLQTTAPAENNYIDVSTDGDAVLNVESVRRDGLHGGLHRNERLPLIEVQSGALEPGDTVTIDYGAGDRRFLLPDFAVDDFMLPLYVRVAEDNPFLTVAVESLKVRPDKASKIEVVLPSLVVANEPVALNGRVEDDSGNLAAGDMPSFEVLIDGIFHGRIPAGPQPLVGLKGIRFEEPGVHRVEVRSSGGGIVGHSNPVLVSGRAPAYRILWGDFHRHSNLSDGVYAPERIRQTSLLDVVTIADHDNYLTGTRWRGLADEVRAFEWSRPVSAGGHHVVLTRGNPDFSSVLRESFPDQRRLVRGLDPADTLVLALPEVPADMRFQDPALTRLVEIKSGEGSFEWFGRRFADAGYRVGFTGSADAHMTRLGSMSSRGLTGLLVARGESWWEALKARRTFVTTGARIIVDMRLNGAMPGSRISPAAERVVEGEIVGTAGVASVELLRNGEVIARRDYMAASEATTDETVQTVKVTFESPSHPWRHQRDLPRNGREWIGYLKVSGADIDSVRAPGFRDTRRQAVAINPNETGRVDFITWTRGQASSFLVDLTAAADPGVTLDLILKSGFEDVDFIPATRPPQPIPGIRQHMSLDELRFGEVVRTLNVEGYRDRITFQRVGTDVPARRTFEFVDRREPGSRDYYYLKITQVDDQVLWTSPVHVGGSDVH